MPAELTERLTDAELAEIARIPQRWLNSARSLREEAARIESDASRDRRKQGDHIVRDKRARADALEFAAEQINRWLPRLLEQASEVAVNITMPPEEP